MVVDEPPLLRTAEEALRLAQLEPERARDLALAVLEAAARSDHAGPTGNAGDTGNAGNQAGDGAGEIATLAERALGLVARELDDIPSATEHLRRSVEIATAAGLALRAAQARMSLSLTLAHGGQSEEALQQADLAAPALPPLDRARLELQRALILQRLGRLEEALEGYHRALPILRRTGSADDEARVLANRGVAYAFRGDLRSAEGDLRRAADLFEQLGQILSAAKARHNLGFVLARGGDIPGALRWYDRAEGEYRRLGLSPAISLVDRAETLLSVRLVPEAIAAANKAAEEFEKSGMEAELAQTRLLVAQALLIAGDVPQAAHIAAVARQSFVEQHRPGWAALASYAGLQAMWAGGDRTPGFVEAARRVVDELQATGWVAPAVDARLITARVALDLGMITDAEMELRALSATRRTGPADVRARAWHAEALLRYARGDRRGTYVALRAGTGVLARHQATLGATELRVHAAGRGDELASLGIRVALEEGRADRVLAWAERGRAVALRWRPALPPADAEIAALLTELRGVVTLLEERGFAAADTAPLLRRQAVLEGQIRRKTWSAEGEHDVALAAPPTVPRLSQALRDTALIELVELDDTLHAVALAGGRASLHSLGKAALVEARVNALRFALRRLAMHGGADASRATEAFADASHELDRLLMGPVAAKLGDRAVVIVPTGPSHALPWATLPSLRGRPVSVAPSAALWLRAASGATPGGQDPVLVGGPGLSHGDDEIAQLRGLYPRATTLTGADATSGRVITALNGSDLVHIAAHGTFRGDNPLFSSLRLVDGPLTVYDFERLRHVPRRIVLSACEGGQSFVTAGNELMGVSSAFLGLGTRTLVASVVAVSDELTRALMLEFHGNLLRGLQPADALARAHVAVGQGDGASRTGGFLCFGAG